MGIGSHRENLFPSLDHTPCSNHTLKGLAPLPGRVKHRTVFQGAGVLGGNECPLDHGFTVALADVGDLQFVVTHGGLVGFTLAGFFPESRGFGKCSVKDPDYTTARST